MASLSDHVYDEILHLIINRPLVEGSFLPTEAQFCKMFSVSRTVVREALARLKTDGIIESRQGRGSVVIRRPNAGVVDYPAVGTIAGMQRWFEFRQVIEAETAFFAAERRSTEELARINTAFDSVQAALERGDSGIEEDLLFHQAIAEAAHNEFLLSALASVGSYFVKSIEFARFLSSKPNRQRGANLGDEHGAIIAAIRAKDGLAARAAMMEHLISTRKRVFLDE